MSKNDVIEVHARIVEALPNSAFKAQLENGHMVIANISGIMRAKMVRLLPGDRVLLQLSPYDLSRGKIIHRG